MDTTLFRCSGCGYEAQVLGGAERDHEAKFKTQVCRSCRSVVDVVVSRLVPGETEFGLPIDRWHAVAFKCPLCEAGGLTPWPATRPCPRCGERMA
jgi:hypothetical protein